MNFNTLEQFTCTCAYSKNLAFYCVMSFKQSMQFTMFELLLFERSAFVCFPLNLG